MCRPCISQVGKLLYTILRQVFFRCHCCLCCLLLLLLFLFIAGLIERFSKRTKVTDVCTKCNESLPDDGSFLTCVVCDYPYRRGICSGITEATKNTKAFRRIWRCQTCVTVQSRGGQNTEPNMDTEVDVLGLLAVMNKKNWTAF